MPELERVFKLFSSLVLRVGPRQAIAFSTEPSEFQIDSSPAQIVSTLVIVRRSGFLEDDHRHYKSDDA